MRINKIEAGKHASFVFGTAPKTLHLQTAVLCQWLVLSDLKYRIYVCTWVCVRVLLVCP